MGDILIRPATTEDADSLSAFFLSVFTEPEAWIPLRADECPTAAALALLLNTVGKETNSAWWLAFAGPQLLASCKLRGGGLAANSHIVTLDLHVAASQRGRGLGRRLLAQGIDWISTHPTVSRIELECFAANTAAIALYESAGFVTEGCRIARYQLRDAYHDTLHMSWRREHALQVASSAQAVPV